jgi:methyl-accepting chemotaxis protein
MIKKHIGVKILISVAVSIIIGMLLISFYFTKQQRQNIMTENERAFRKLTETVSEGFQAIMLEGDADIAQNFASGLKKVSEIEDFRLLRINGLEAFYDNKTIYNVNKRIGEEEFIPRETESEKLVISKEQEYFKEAISSQTLTSFYERTKDGNHVLTLFNPVLNRKECFSCHGSAHEVRGVIKITTSVDQVDHNIRKSLIGSLLMISLLTVVIIAFISYLVRKISMPIQQVANNLQNISDGDGNLDVSLNVQGHDEIAQLSKGFNKFVGKTRGIVQNVAGVTVDLSDMAEHLSINTNKTNKNIDEQRSSIQEIATSIEELATSIDEVSHSAQQGAEIANQVDEQSKSGKSEMDRTVKLMNQLSERVEGGSHVIQDLHKEMENIGKILSVIEEITDQTNILAVNASIEASRAGDQGRGFAVVASEVRKLADRTNESTTEITAIIKNLRLRSDDALQVMKEGRESATTSMKQANETSELLNTIATSVSKISELSQYISNAVIEERKAAELMSMSVSNLNRFADGTATESDSTAASSVELAHLSEQLKSLVRQFKV